jgi:hypothetical protein
MLRRVLLILSAMGVFAAMYAVTLLSILAFSELFPLFGLLALAVVGLAVLAPNSFCKGSTKDSVSAVVMIFEAHQGAVLSVDSSVKSGRSLLMIR